MNFETDDVDRAAGGVVWRHASNNDAGVEIIVVHRPKYDDWSLPKGKLDPDETWEAAAVREVWEETGLYVDVGRFLGQVDYVPRTAGAHVGESTPRPKVVRYWAMTFVGGEFTPNSEVDEVRWLRPDDVLALLTHALDRDVVQRFLDSRA
ncbi:NUDIX hydrolase [Actinobacteria bacterium YIM 96077]|uniref:NUDIX hydrolase n=1 Tax=Phytoactinopolyspora halophila TaxID=1981511 RepID=A0A329R1V9_9ACTN|nr:NUDIX hydrolase [Phytoactinopolyspora halophila]AYY12111.1 NUDIX hydrolase [Actinobacteria bacterium YIM 96077]RAW18654.1 NUDIX hydrolase [Phytoactinopolyspora halophila]